MVSLLQVALAAVTMRRRKDSTFEGAPIVQLPPRTVNVVEVPFATAEERSFYDDIEAQSQVGGSSLIIRN